ncbi:MAG: hypothetical protein AABZ06_07370 [Bdellovibrionota bacterium]
MDTKLPQNETKLGPAVNDTIEVLYQKMGNRWFVFSLIGEDVFVGSLPENGISTKVSSAIKGKIFKITGTS